MENPLNVASRGDEVREGDTVSVPNPANGGRTEGKVLSVQRGYMTVKWKGSGYTTKRRITNTVWVILRENGVMPDGHVKRVFGSSLDL